MRTKTTYSRFLQNVVPWSEYSKGQMIQSLHHCIEHDISSFATTDFSGRRTPGKLFGIALSESGLSRDEIQLLAKYSAEEDLIATVENLLIELESDYLDLLLLQEEQLTEAVRMEVEQLMSQGKLMEVGGVNLAEEKLSGFGLALRVNLFPSPLQVAGALKRLPPIEKVPEEVTYFVNLETSRFNDSLPGIIDELAPTYHCTPTQLYLAWLLQHPADLHLEVDFTEKEDLAAAMEVKEKRRLDAIDWQKIKLALG